MEQLHDLRQTLTREGILICFNGPFSQSIIEELGKAVKGYLEREEVRKSALMDVFSVYIEATQNVRNYASRPEWSGAVRQRLNSGIVIISRQADHYIVSSGNPVRDADAAALMARISALQPLDKPAMKSLYKERLRTGRSEAEPSAGLGLIDMARRASLPLQAGLFPDGDGYAFFLLRVII